MKANRANKAVTEVFGTILLVAMAVSTFAAVSVVVMHPYLASSDPPPISVVTIIGMIEANGTTDGSNVILEHHGGYSLRLDAKITVILAGTSQSTTAGPNLVDSNGDGLWSIGERWTQDVGNVTDKKVEVLVFDMERKILIMRGVLHDGTTATTPYVITGGYEVEEGKAKLHLFYNFLHNYSGKVRFLYGPDGEGWNSTEWYPSNTNLTFWGGYSKEISVPATDKLINYTAQLNYSGIVISGETKCFYYDDWQRGIWHLNDSDTPDIADDSSRYGNDGTLKPENPITEGPQWTNTAVSGKALSFDGINDYVEVRDHESLDLTDKISIKAWVKPNGTGGQFPGRITEIDTQDFKPWIEGGELDDCYEPDLIHVSGNIYAIAYRSSEGAFVATVEILSGGSIVNVINNQPIAVPYFLEPDIIRIGGGTYAIAYGSPSGAIGCLATVKITDDDGVINVLNTYKFRKFYGREPRIIHVKGDIYAISYGGSSNPFIQSGYLVTVKIIKDSGTIGYIDELEFNQTNCLETDIIDIDKDNGVYAIAYSIGVGQTTQSGILMTVKIPDDGRFMGNDILYTMNFDTHYGLEPDIIHVSGNIYAIAYGTSSDLSPTRGVLRTIKIYNNGQIGDDTEGAEGVPSDKFIDTLVFDTLYCLETDIIHVGNNIYAIAYAGGNDQSTILKTGFLITVDIDSEGVIVNSIVDTLEFATPYGREPSIVQLATGTEAEIFYSISYGGNDDCDGFLATVKIDLTGTIKGIVAKNGAYEIESAVSKIFATINDDVTISGSIALEEWNFVVLTYDMSYLRLYIVNDDGLKMESERYTALISTNENNLIFGGLKGILDEIEIYSIVLDADEIAEEYSAKVPQVPTT